MNGFIKREIKEANIAESDAENWEIYERRWGQEINKKSSISLIRQFEKIFHRKFDRVDRLLDLGCGGGYLFLNLALHGLAAECYAADISKGALKVTEKKATNFGIAGFFIECDFENLPLKDASFDMIAGNGVLHHLPDMEKALSEIKRVLKPGGIAIFLHEPNKRGNEICSAVIKGVYFLPMIFAIFLRKISKKEVTHRANVHPTDSYPYLNQFEQIAKNIGFSEVFTETEGFTWCIPHSAYFDINYQYI
jgi:ubiquinone/menaquinone biosynthesis C-methylase UbiE